LQVTGGTALAALNLSTDASQLVGTDGKVQVDGAAEQVFNDIEAGQQVTLNSTAGAINATISGGLRSGTVNANNVSVGDGSLATVVSNINSAGAGVTATAVQVGTGAYRLQINSNSAGLLNGSNVDSSEFNSSVGSLVELTAASDAKITVGSGAGAYSVTSGTNTVSGVLPGVTLQLKALSATPVTITVSRDASALAAKVKALVDAANTLQASVKVATDYDASTNTASPLTGDPSAERILSDLALAATDAVAGANPGSPGLAGLSINADGTFAFDQTKFTNAFNADPAGVTRLFSQGGSSTNPQVTFVSAGDNANGGSYDVNVTALATQATSTGWNGVWPSTGGQTINVRVGSKVVSYTTQANDTQQTVINELNNRFGQQGILMQASVNGNGIQLQANQYGTAAGFDVAWDGATYTTVTGTDVQGTIGGVAATGSGQQLSIPWDNTAMGGLALNITSTVTGDLGTFTYSPGAAQRISSAMTRANDPLNGYVIAAENSLQDDMKFIDSRVAEMQSHLQQYQAQLNTTYSNLETTISQLRSSAGFLSAQTGSSSSG
jgi:flagellar hook-associated protein 2